MVTIKKLFLLIFFCFGIFHLKAQDVKVISSGQGTTQDEATRVALRNALEDAFGAFISSSSKIENDILVSDEIVSLTQGNIKKYDIISLSQLESKMYSITVASIVSLNKLSSYCESKGMSVEFNGSVFGINLKTKEFNRRNERKILQNLCLQLIAMTPKIFDFELKMAEPKINEENIVIPTLIVPECNSNYEQMETLVKSTLQSISLSKEEQKEYRKLGLRPYRWSIYGDSEAYYFRDESSIKLFSRFYREFRTKLSFNWSLVDDIIDKPFSFDLIISYQCHFASYHLRLHEKDSRYSEIPVPGFPGRFISLLDDPNLSWRESKFGISELKRNIILYFGEKYSKKQSNFEYVEGNIIKNIKAENLAKIMGLIYYR
mgnify:FL=1